MGFAKYTNFALGEVSPEYAFKTEILESGAALKNADNVIITPAASISNRPGSLMIKKSEDFKSSIESFSFTFNRYQSYMCLILPNEESGLTKLRIYDNIGTLMTDTDINLPYSVDDIENLNTFALNDIMFFYCAGYNIMILKRVSLSEFKFDTFNVNAFKNLRRSATGLYVYYNALEARWEIMSSAPYFADDILGKRLFVANNFNSSNNSFNTTLVSYESNTIFAKAISFNITCTNNTTVTIYSSLDGVNFKTVYVTQIPAANAGTYVYADDSNAYFFKVKLTQTIAGKIDVSYAVSAFTFFHNCVISQKINDYRAVITVDYDTEAYQKIFISNNPTKDIVDLALNDADHGTASYYADVATPNSIPNNNILGLENTSSIKSVYQTNFNSGKGSYEPVFKYTYVFKNAVVVNRVRMKGLLSFKITASGRTALLELQNSQAKVILTNSTGNIFIVLVQDIKAVIEESEASFGQNFTRNVTVDISLENLNYLNIVTIEYQLIIPAYRFAGTNIGAPRYIDLYTFRVQGYQYAGADQETITRYSYYYGFANDMHPNTGCVFQNRHFIADTSMIASYMAAYDNFNNLATDMVSDEMPFAIDRNTEKFGQALQLVPFRQGILSLTTDQEIFYFAEGAFTPSTYNRVIMGERGNENVKPCVMEQGFLGVERGGDLYFQSFELASGSYGRRSLRKYAEHLFKGKKIKKIETLMSSDKAVFILFTDGTMIRMYLDVAAGIIAFMHFTISGHIYTISTIDNSDIKELWAVIDDKMVKLCDSKDLYQCTLDLALKYENIEEFIIPSHLTSEERFVFCFDDKGMWRETIKENAGEIHKLSRPAVTAYAGIAYTSEFEMLDFGAFNADFSATQGRAATAEMGLVNAYGLEIEGSRLPEEVDEQGYLKLLNGKYNGIRLNSKLGYEKRVKVKCNGSYPWTVASLSLAQDE